jgi:hypothetical protein
MLQVVQTAISVQLLGYQDLRERDNGIYWYKGLMHVAVYLFLKFYGNSCRRFLLCLVHMSCPALIVVDG